SSEALYTNSYMISKLVFAYEEMSKDKKTLIFNNGINTSKEVYYAFKRAGYNIKHLDNTCTKQERKDILKWFKNTPNGILTSVSILTTGFDEPTVESVILNRATRSLTLYFQMIGRGSRVLENKSKFTVIDLGNNVVRFGPWQQPDAWQHITKYTDTHSYNVKDEEAPDRAFGYLMADGMRPRSKKSQLIESDPMAEYAIVVREGL